MNISKRIFSPTLAGSAALALAFVLAGCNSGSSSGTGSTSGTASTSGSTGGSTSSDNALRGRPPVTADGNKVTGDKIILGLVASEEGNLKPWGVDSMAGAQLAVNEVNKAGGINGKQVQLLVEDSNSKPEQGKSACEKLMSEGAICILGEVASGITAQMIPPAFDKGIPLVAIGATKTSLTDYGNNVFRVCYTDALQGPVMATFAYKDLGLRRAVLITDKTQPYSTGLSESFRQYFIKLGGKVVDEQFYDGSQPSYTAQATQVKADNPDVVFMSGYFTETGPLAKFLRQAGVTAQLLGGDGWDSADILNSGGNEILGSYFCNHYNSLEQRPEVQGFLAKWKAAYAGTDHGSQPGTTMGALAYDAAGLVCDALKRSKGLDSKDLLDAIANTVGYKGVTGVITLKGHDGDPPKDAIVVKLEKDPRAPNGQIFAKRYTYADIFPNGAQPSK